jgi:hypothetical protein
MEEKNNYIESVKEILLKISDEESTQRYETLIGKEDIQATIGFVCDYIRDFSGDIWDLAEIVASIVFDRCQPNLPGAAAIAYMVHKIFRHGIESICSKAMTT